MFQQDFHVLILAFFASFQQIEAVKKWSMEWTLGEFLIVHLSIQFFSMGMPVFMLMFCV